MDRYEFNGKRYDVATQVDFRLMLADLTGVTDELIEQVETLKPMVVQTVEQVRGFNARQPVSAGSEIGLSAAFASMIGRGGQSAPAVTPQVPALPPSGATTPNPTSLTIVRPYDATAAYQPLSVVLYGGGLYQWQGGQATTPGTSPLNSTSWVALSQAVDSFPTSQWTYVDINNPALGAVSAPASTITALQKTAGTAFTVVPGVVPGTTTQYGHLDLEIAVPQNTPGITLPTDALVSVQALVSWSASSLSWTVTPYWVQEATAAAAAIAAAAAGVYRASLRYRQRP